MRVLYSIFLIILSGINTLCFSQDFDRAKMDKLFSLIEQSNMGMNSVSIFMDGEEVYQRSIGYADLENKIKSSKATKYRIGSISKSFTASIIMKFIEEGKITLDTRLSRFYPEVKNSRRISIEHLLRHRSGIFNFTSAEDYTSWMEKPLSKEEAIEKIVAYGSSFEPDARAEYSNANYVLLAYIAEKITGEEFSVLIDSMICKVCGLENTYYGGKIDPENNEAYSYRRMSDWELATETDMSVPSGAGGIVSNPSDLNIFFTCLNQGKIVSEPTLEKMMHIKDGFGLGLFQIPFFDKVAYGHNGGIDGFASNASYFPEEGVSIAFTTNGQVMPMNDILIGVLSIYFNEEYELPELKMGIELKSEDLDPYLGTYSTPDFPLKLTITKVDNQLFGQGTGQSPFPLEAFGEHIFRFIQAGVEMTFDPEAEKVFVNQGGRIMEMSRE